MPHHGCRLPAQSSSTNKKIAPRFHYGGAKGTQTTTKISYTALVWENICCAVGRTNNTQLYQLLQMIIVIIF